MWFQMPCIRRGYDSSSAQRVRKDKKDRLHNLGAVIRCLLRNDQAVHGGPTTSRHLLGLNVLDSIRFVHRYVHVTGPKLLYANTTCLLATCTMFQQKLVRRHGIKSVSGRGSVPSKLCMHSERRGFQKVCSAREGLEKTFLSFGVDPYLLEQATRWHACNEPQDTERRHRAVDQTLELFGTHSGCVVATDYMQIRAQLSSTVGFSGIMSRSNVQTRLCGGWMRRRRGKEVAQR